MSMMNVLARAGRAIGRSIPLVVRSKVECRTCKDKKVLMPEEDTAPFGPRYNPIEEAIDCPDCDDKFKDPKVRLDGSNPSPVHAKPAVDRCPSQKRINIKIQMAAAEAEQKELRAKQYATGDRDPK